MPLKFAEKNLTSPLIPWHPGIHVLVMFAAEDCLEILSIRLVAMLHYLHMKVALGVSHRLREVIRGLSWDNLNAVVAGHQI